MLSERDEFAEHLFQEGYPLWSPDPLRLPDDRESVGIKMGDVGAVDKDGHFDLFFNICEPPHDDLHDNPSGFTVIREPEVVPNFQRISPRNVVSSPQTSWTFTDLQPAVYSHKRTLYRAKLAANGAHIILPHGADQYELNRRDQALFMKLARQHGREWYMLARDQFALGSDPLYLITGFYRTCSWSLASFRLNTDADVRVRCEVEHGDERKILRNESFWNPRGRFGNKIGPAPENEGRKNQNVFISGIVITANEQVLKQEPQAVGLQAFFSRLLLREPTNDAADPPMGGRDDIQVSIDHFPGVRQKVSHPGEIINRYLLAKEPSAGIAITHDVLWMTLVETGQLSTIEDLEMRVEELITEHYSINVENGTVYLNDKESAEQDLQSITQVEETPFIEGGLAELRDNGILPSSSSLRITTEQRICDVNEVVLKPDLPESDAMSQLGQLTDAGHHALALPMPPPPGFSSDFTEYPYPISLERTPWAPPPVVPPPKPMPPPPWPGQNPYPAWNTFTQPLPGQPLPGQPLPGQLMHGQHMHGQPWMYGQPWMHGQPMPWYHPYTSPNVGWLYTPAVAAWPMATPPQPSYGGYGQEWQHPTLQPPPMNVHGPPGDSARTAFRWTNNTDRMDPFTEGPHYGPVLEPFICKVVGAVIRLNPLLAPPADAQEDYLRWNMVFQVSNCYRTSESKRSWIRGRKAPATHPRVTHIRIISRTFPWMIDARAQNPKIGVTCGEILDAISAYLHADVGKEYECMPQHRKRQIWESYKLNRSTVPGVVLGDAMKRLDYLGSTSRFGGLIINDDFVKAQFGSGLPCTFELKCLLSYPMTQQELREQQQRQENPTATPESQS